MTRRRENARIPRRARLRYGRRRLIAGIGLLAVLVASIDAVVGFASGQGASLPRPRGGGSDFVAAVTPAKSASKLMRTRRVLAGVAVGKWVALPDARLARSEVSAAVVDGYAYVVGGFGADARSSAAVERLDLRTGTWTIGVPLPRALNHMSAVGYRHSLYVVGGYSQPTDTSAGAVRDFWRFDPRSRRWTQMPRAPIARAAAGAAVLGHRLHVAGGRNDAAATISTTAIFDFDTGRWSIGPPLHHAREHVAAVAADGAVWLLGGRALGQGNFADVERLRPGSHAWQRMAAMPIPRSSFQAVEVMGSIVVVGGEGPSGTIGRVDELDPRTGRWIRLADLATPRHGLGVVADGSLVYAIEGGPHAGLTTSRVVERLRVP